MTFGNCYKLVYLSAILDALSSKIPFTIIKTYINKFDKDLAEKLDRLSNNEERLDVFTMYVFDKKDDFTKDCMILKNLKLQNFSPQIITAQKDAKDIKKLIKEYGSPESEPFTSEMNGGSKRRSTKRKSKKRSTKRRSKRRSTKCRSKKRSTKRKSKKRSTKRKSKKRSTKRKSKKRSTKRRSKKISKCKSKKRGSKKISKRKKRSKK